jgi:ribosome assembly protein YihI (activator of Der GTPase)
MSPTTPKAPKRAAKKTAKVKKTVTFDSLDALSRAAKRKGLPRGTTAAVTGATLTFSAKGQADPLFSTGDFTKVGNALIKLLGIKNSASK